MLLEILLKTANQFKEIENSTRKYMKANVIDLKLPCVLEPLAVTN